MQYNLKTQHLCLFENSKNSVLNNCIIEEEKVIEHFWTNNSTDRDNHEQQNKNS